MEKDIVSVGIYGDELPSSIKTVPGLVSFFENGHNLKVTNVSGDVDCGWEMTVTGPPESLYRAICGNIAGYNAPSIQDFIDEYQINRE